VRRGQFNHPPINWIATARTGEVYVIDGPDLRRVNRDGTISTVARISNAGLLFGITLDPDGNIYVAGLGDRAVFRVTPAGAVRVVARSTAPWAPSGVAISPRGELWLLEWAGSEARVRRAH
jgi:DNA-binding beta-propeller fold protein YncE